MIYCGTVGVRTLAPVIPAHASAGETHLDGRTFPSDQFPEINSSFLLTVLAFRVAGSHPVPAYQINPLRPTTHLLC